MFGGRRTIDEEDVYHASSVADALSALRNSQTRWLVANGRGFGDEEAVRIARALHHNKNLQELSLAGNRIGPEGAEALGQAVGVHPFLKEFYLQKNRLGQDGIERFAAAIQSGGAPRLEVINASSNGIGPKFPAGLALPSLKSLIVKNNNIQELPSCYGECEKLSNVVLDNNPLVSPPQDVYISNGWYAIRSFLVSALNREREQNRAVGVGNISNHRRDEALLGPVRKHINRGALQDAALALEKARSVYVRLGASHEVLLADDLAKRLLSVMAMDDASVFPVHLDCCFRAESATASTDDGLLMARHLISEKAPFLASYLCDSGYDVAVSLRGQNHLRKVVDVPGTSRAGLRCFLAFLLLDDVRQALSISARLENVGHGSGATAGSSDGQSSDDCESEEDSDASSTSSAPETAPNKKPPPVPPAAASLPLGGYISSLSWEGGVETPTGGEETATGTEEGTGMGAGGMEVEGEEGWEGVGLGGELGVLLEAAELGKRFAVEAVERQVEKVLYQRLQPWNVIGTLKAAHRRGNAEVKRVCMGYLDEHGEQVEESEWAQLGQHCDLMMEVMDSLARSDGRPPSARWMVSSELMRHVLERLELAEQKANEAQSLREQTEAQLQKLQQLLSTGDADACRS